MKLRVLLLLSVMSMASFGWFEEVARCQINGNQATCTITNRYSERMECLLSGSAITESGLRPNSTKNRIRS